MILKSIAALILGCLMTVASMTGEWLRGIKPDDRHRKVMLLKIRDALARQGVAVG
jgi:hypothetical protein